MGAKTHKEVAEMTTTPGRVAIAFVLAALVASLVLGPASAGPPGRWTQITQGHSGARSNLGLARGEDGRLHVLWAGPARAPHTAIRDTPITLRGAVGGSQTVVSGWVGVNPPTAATAADGSVHAVISGQRTSSNTDPFAGLNEAVGPGSWRLGPRAFGNSSITVASNADVHAAFLKSGQLVSVWQTAAALLFQVGVDPSTAPQNITPAGDPATNPVLAVDPGSGEAVIAYHGAASGSNFFRRIQPTVGAPQAIPQSRGDAPSIAARAGGGVYTAYTPDGNRVVLVRFGGPSRAVPVPRGTRVLTAGVAAGPEGRLWVFYGNEQRTYATRTSKSVSGFEPVQAFASPAKTVQYFRLEGEGSAGPLDLFADVTIDGQAKDGSYHQQVWPVLSLRASKKAAGGTVQVTVRVTDAGDAVAGARVTGLPVGTKATDAKGTIVFTVPARRHGSFALTATKSGYHPAKAKLSL
jgi:hypothetical protein